MPDPGRAALRPASAAPAAGCALALLLVSAAGAQTLDRYGGGALPPAPYAQQGQPAVAPAYAAGSVRAYPGMTPDRMGARTPFAPPQTTIAPATSTGLRTLSWPGKEQAAAQLPAPMVTAAYRSPAPTYAILPTPSQRYAPMPVNGRLQPRAFSQPPTTVDGQATPAPAYAFAAPTTIAMAAPTSIYSDAPATTAQRPQPHAYAPSAALPQPSAPVAFAAADGGSRQYSLHRDYGLAPDPAPIPPQFFANTADLSAPETPDVVTTPRVTGNATTARATENAARLAASATP